MSLPITTLYALPLVVLWLVLFFRVSGARSDLGQSFGDGGNMALLQKVRQHGNFIECVPFTLLLLLLAEAQGAGALWLHAAGALLVVGRVLHPFGLRQDTAGHPLRYAGNGTNLLAVAILVVCLVLVLIAAPTAV